MLVRAISGAVYVALIIICVLLGGWLLHIVFAIINFLLIWEFCSLFKSSEYSPNALVTSVYATILYFFGVLMVEFMHEPNGHFYLGMLVILGITAVIWFGVFELVRPTKKPLQNVLISVGGLIYIVPSMILINFLSVLGPENANLFPLLGLFIMIWTYDTFAYLTGKQFGKHKMAKNISPNKTWEGFIGGVAFSFLAGLLIAYFQPDQPFIAYAMLGLIAGGFGMLGDLFESMIKRQLNLKDSGNIMPGHGGILDRFDSVLFVIPMSFIVIILFIFYLS